MELINFHVHSTGSDGKLSPEEVVKEAINAGLRYMCFTDHYFYPKGDYFEGHRDKFFTEDYVKEVKRLQKEYKDKIDISFGAEMDWLPKHTDWIKNEIKRQNFDYVLGSLHNLYAKSEYFFLFYGENWKQEWLDSANRVGGARKFVEAYYSQIGKMAKSKLFDCVAHFDIIKFYNIQNIFFSEEDLWYKKAVLKALIAVKEADIAIEINTHGYVKPQKEQYPSFWILKEANKMGIPITIGTDAHFQGELSKDLDKAYKLAKQAGYKEIVRFKARNRINIAI